MRILNRIQIYNLIFVILLFCLFANHSLIGQSNYKFFCGYKNSINSNNICANFKYGEIIQHKDADKIVQKILDVVGLPFNFILQSCPGIENAYALNLDNGIRCIAYDPLFIEKIVKNSSNWASISILAHEVGHHLCGHTLSNSTNLSIRRKMELEADEFSGFVLNKLGANIEQSTLAIDQLSEQLDSNSTHPNKYLRVFAIKTGFYKALNLNYQINIDSSFNLNSYETILSVINHLESQEKYQEIILLTDKIIQNTNYQYIGYGIRGLMKYNLGDFTGAISDYTKTLNLRPGVAMTYNNLGNAKSGLKLYQEAIEQYNSAILLDSTDYFYFYNRGIAKYRVEDFKGAIVDFSYAIGINQTDADLLINRGIVFDEIGEYSLALKDFDKAIELNDGIANAFKMRAYVFYNIEKFEEALLDYEMALKLSPNDWIIYEQKAKIKEKMNDFNGAILDFTMAINLNPTNNYAYYMRGNIKHDLKLYYEAILDYSKAIEIDKSDSNSYFARSISKNRVDDFKGSVEDLDKVIELEPNKCEYYFYRGNRKYFGKLGGYCEDYKIACNLCIDKCEAFNEKCK